jgi:hypothetical protein
MLAWLPGKVGHWIPGEREKCVARIHAGLSTHYAWLAQQHARAAHEVLGGQS